MLLLEKNISPTIKIGVWEIQNSEAWFLDRLELLDIEQAELVTLKGQKRLDWLADRYVLHLLLGGGKRIFCYKDDFGKPFLADENKKISFSNSASKAAAIVADRSVGIDIQYLTPKIERIAKKFLSDQELAYLTVDATQRLSQLHVLWGAKEALYKAYGKKELDFRLHISVKAFDFSHNGGHIVGTVTKGDFAAQYDIFYESIKNFILVYCVRVEVCGK
jgi:4'-phosphopantetheinyl transferase